MALKTYPISVAVLLAGSSLAAVELHDVTCEGVYPHHLQGISADQRAIYWCFTTVLVKTDLDGKVLKTANVAYHHGDLCIQGEQLCVAVNLGKFNDPQGNADSWIYVYDAADLKLADKHSAQEVTYGAGGIGVRDGRFFVVGGLPEGVEQNFVYEYDGDFRFIQRHVIESGATKMGIQTATFADDRWWFGCYGNPRLMLVTRPDFTSLEKHEFDCSLGIAGLADGRLLVARGRTEKSGCYGSARIAVADHQTGLRFVDPK